MGTKEPLIGPARALKSSTSGCFNDTFGHGVIKLKLKILKVWTLCLGPSSVGRCG